MVIANPWLGLWKLKARQMKLMIGAKPPGILAFDKENRWHLHKF